VAANSGLTMAAHALCWLELARRRGELVLSSARVAQSLASHPVAVRRSLGLMRDAGLVTSGRGRGAGWSLTRPAEQITLLDVYDALGKERPFALHPHEPNLECPVGFGIRPVLDDVYVRVESRLRDVLAGYTVAGLLEELLRKHPLPQTSAG